MANFFTFKKDDFTCSHCGWKGKGKELANGEFHEEHYIFDLNCPSCHEHIGFWQAPLEKDIKKWQEENPGVEPDW